MTQQYPHQWVRDRLPHRWPFLLVDKVTKITKNSIEGYKNVSASDVAFLGHFSEVSIMPGVFVVETLAQISGLLLISKQEETDQNQERGYVNTKVGLLTSIRGFKFLKIIEPGDRLSLKSILKGGNENCFIFAVSAYVDDHEVAVGEIQIFLQEREVVM